jgi:thiol:disulfide interchange protein DsbC
VGAKDWRQSDGSGRFPPPPLNGSAHTWHHSLDVLARVIRDGGGKVGGYMPAFRDVLDRGQSASILAYLQSLWPERIYDTWAESYSADARDGISAGGGPRDGSLTALLSGRLGQGSALSAPAPTPLDGVFVVKAGEDYLYLVDNGRYALLGDLVNLETGANHTETLRSQDRLAALERFPAEDMIVFEAWDEARANLTVLTDTTCPFCRRLHAELPELQAEGVTVRYVPFPRGGETGPGYAELRSVWCAEDRVAAANEAMQPGIQTVNDGRCARASAVDAGHRLGTSIQLRGTPGILLPDGRLIQGYRPAAELLQALGLGP